MQANKLMDAALDALGGHENLTTIFVQGEFAKEGAVALVVLNKKTGQVNLLQYAYNQEAETHDELVECFRHEMIYYDSAEEALREMLLDREIASRDSRSTTIMDRMIKSIKYHLRARPVEKGKARCMFYRDLDNRLQQVDW